MALQKQPISINFSKGIETKTDKFQVQIGSFLTLVNSVFTTTGRLTKRNGFQNVTSLPNTDQTTLTTLNDNLIATGSNLYAFSKDTEQWLNRGLIQPIQLSAQPMIRSSTSQSSPDTAIASNGIACLVYMDTGASYYQMSDSITGQQVKSRVLLPNASINPRVFILGAYFIITFMSDVSGTPTLQYMAIPTANPTITGTATNISADVASQIIGYDAYSANNSLYVSWESTGNNVKILSISNSLVISSATTLATSNADLMSVTVDSSTNRVWISFWDLASQDGYSAAFDNTLTPVVAKTKIINNIIISEITTLALSNVLTVFYETINNYSYTDLASDAIRSDYISSLTVVPPVSGTGVGTVSSALVVLRSVGLASKAFMADSGVIYLLVAYGDTNQINSLDNSNQATYFLIDSIGNIYMRLAYSNGGGYASSQVLPSVSVIDNAYFVPYQTADFLATVNKTTNPPSGTPSNAIYTQYGINLATFTIDIKNQYSSEIAGALHLTGGQLWEYDAVKPVEHGFHVWPENIRVTTSGSGGSIAAGTYNYVFTYEWTDNQGMLHRSAPSIPVSQVTTGSTSTNTIKVPTLRLTYKITPNPVRIVGYRWSVAQQVYYQFTSITSPTLNNPAIDSVSFTDTHTDLSILGQTILYTTGGMIENIAAPASVASALFNNRLFLIDAEDRNLLWFSKQVIEGVPIEMSDLLTLFIAPTTGAQGSTGPMIALGAMDEKLIIFKRNAIYYINGSGPDNTGANSSFSDPVFITSTVGCNNPNSVVLMPNGIMFQSDKGIWLLGRDLSTTYIGSPVELYNNQIVMSATAIPGTNQVRFVLDNKQTLMYDYFVNQWGTHTNVSAISATLYQNEHTYLNSYGQIFQEQENTYLDGSVPVLMSLTTSWINIAGLQGYERFYQMFVLGTYYTPFKLIAQMAYDYNASAEQAVTILPDNYSPNWGGEANWGSGKGWGGSDNVFEARVFPKKQKCESFQITLNEVYDPSFGIPSGQGLSLSGLNLICGMKKGYRVQSARKSFG